jgi:ASC-1-like (ASCH) protein
MYDNLVQLYNLVVRRLQLQGDTEPIEEFETDIEYIEELITRIRNPMTQESLQRKYVDIFYSAKKVPVTKAKSYDMFKAMVQNFSEDIIEVDERARKELAIVENMGFEVVPEEQTEEEANVIAEDLRNKKAEAAKRNK